MKKKYLLLKFAIFLFFTTSYSQNNQIEIFNNVIFYDGYAATNPSATTDGSIRLSNSRYAKKMSQNEIADVLNTLTLNVKIDALCDNYDRQGGVFFSFVPAGEEMTSQNKKTIEIGRFITPFMNKNRTPNQVSYTYELNHLVGIFKNSIFLNANDIWVEFFLFGVPYAANTQVEGCQGRTDVFQGTLTFNTTSANNPIMNYTPKALWNRLQMNKTNNSDFNGTAGRIIYFTVNNQLIDANVQLITSAHGASQGGEEYIRRDHFVSFDNNQILTYKPGGVSCEPFRYLNTQGNGIYGASAQSSAWWASWNNWCPGDVIPNRLIPLGNVAVGDHSFKVTVPSGQFLNENDEVYLSAFIYSNDNSVLNNDTFETIDYKIFPNPVQSIINIEASIDVKRIDIYDSLGRNVLESNYNSFDISTLPEGVYFLQIEFINGKKLTEKIIKSK